ncbi:hypothetical protein QJS66_04410 [Kocuria rhizophila]|nr:hypothetical protein QJS66_04410 [Kocuria rhizophila]
MSSLVRRRMGLPSGLSSPYRLLRHERTPGASSPSFPRTTNVSRCPPVITPAASGGAGCPRPDRGRRRPDTAETSRLLAARDATSTCCTVPARRAWAPRTSPASRGDWSTATTSCVEMDADCPASRAAPAAGARSSAAQRSMAIGSATSRRTHRRLAAERQLISPQRKPVLADPAGHRHPRHHGRSRAYRDTTLRALDLVLRAIARLLFQIDLPGVPSGWGSRSWRCRSRSWSVRRACCPR